MYCFKLHVASKCADGHIGTRDLRRWFRARILRSLQSGSKYEVEYLDFQVSEDSKEKLKNHFQVEKIRPVQPASEFDPKPGQLVDGSWRDGWYSARYVLGLVLDSSCTVKRAYTIDGGC